MREAAIEARLCRKVKDRGGLCLKWVSPGMPGVPDRIVVTPAGITYYVELKTTTGSLRNMQRYVLGELERRGALVYVLKGPEAVDEFMREVFGDAI